MFLDSSVELAECIVEINNIDERIKNGDPEVVNEIARCNGNINLFSFASKYCCYHNKNLYGRDDYSILDAVLKEPFQITLMISQVLKLVDGKNHLTTSHTMII